MTKVTSSCNTSGTTSITSNGKVISGQIVVDGKVVADCNQQALPAETQSEQTTILHQRVQPSTKQRVCSMAGTMFLQSPLLPKIDDYFVQQCLALDDKQVLGLSQSCAKAGLGEMIVRIPRTIGPGHDFRTTSPYEICLQGELPKFFPEPQIKR